MTPEEAKRELEKALFNLDDDPERWHIVADDVIVEFLKDNGFEELSDLYNEITEQVYYA